MGQVIHLRPENRPQANDDIVRYVGRNRYGQRCGWCGDWVHEQEGDLFRDDHREKWVVLHRTDCQRKVQRVGKSSNIYWPALMMLGVCGTFLWLI